MEIKLTNGNTLEIYRDDHGESPREWDNLSTMYCWHRRYTLGDTQADLPDDMDVATIMINIYAYTKGGISIATHPFMCQWDSGQLGIAIVTPEEVIANYGDFSQESQQKAIKCIESEVEVYNYYLQGEVYGYSLKDSEGEEIDSCFGFYGDDFASNGLYEHAGITEKEVA